MKKFTKNSGIYCFENLINGKKYVGRAKKIRVRINQHLRQLKLGIDQCVALQNAWNKNGEESFFIYIIEECSSEELDSKEIFWIKELHSHVTENGYNLSWGGVATFEGLKHSEETKRKMSESGKRLPPRSEEWRKSLSEANKGKIISEDTRRKISEANTGRKASLEEKTNHSNSLIGHKHSEETKKKISMAKKGKPNNWLGRQHTEESKEKMSKIKTGKHPDQETKWKMSKSHGCSSGLMGVSFHKKSGKFATRITLEGKRIQLGLFENKIEAAIAYNEVATEFYGTKAKLNNISEEEYNSVMINS